MEQIWSGMKKKTAELIWVGRFIVHKNQGPLSSAVALEQLFCKAHCGQTNHMIITNGDLVSGWFIILRVIIGVIEIYCHIVCMCVC